MSGGESAEARAGMRKRNGSGKRIWSLILEFVEWPIFVCLNFGFSVFWHSSTPVKKGPLQSAKTPEYIRNTASQYLDRSLILF